MHFHAFRYYSELMIGATLVDSKRPEDASAQGQYQMTFERQDGERFAMAWSHGTTAAVPAEPCEVITDQAGHARTPELLDGSPIFLRHLRTMAAATVSLLADFEFGFLLLV